MSSLLYKHQRPFVITVLSLCILSLTLTGCEPLRKKFTRKKKEDTKAVEPILTPIDYGTPNISPQERYAYHYSLWKVWQDEIIEAINEEESDKKQKYLFSQILLQLGEMNKWIVNEKKEELAALTEKMAALEQELEKPAALRNSFSFRKKIELIGKDIRHALSPRVVAPPQAEVP